MEPIIEVKELWKEYRRGAKKDQYLSLRDRLRLPIKLNANKETFYALENINFKVNRGDSLAILGRNGAGKSTLLKILSRITPPTRGNITISGRLSSLLEVGTGFHPELTGRENIYLNGSILGLKRFEINRQFDAIVDFSGVENFLDTPLKHYSSGMQLRLAFAVAAHLEPEILIIDEVLAVGDSAFQKKCIDRMNHVSKEDGKTLIFVSHSMAFIQKLCKYGLWLDEGKIKNSGPVEKIISEYTLSTANSLDNDLLQIRRTAGTGEVKFKAIRIENEEGQELREVKSGDNIVIRIDMDNQSEKHSTIDVGISFHDTAGDRLCNFYGSHRGQWITIEPQEKTISIRCRITRFPFPEGVIYIKGKINSEGQTLDWPAEYLAKVNVINGDFYQSGIIKPDKWGSKFLIDASFKD